MLTRYLCAVSLVLLGFLAMSSTPALPEGLAIEIPNTVDHEFKMQLTFSPQDRSDEYTLIKGILTAKVKEEVWYQCGVRVPTSLWYPKAVEIAEACLYTARPLGVDPVGQLATWQQESRLDPCALGTYPRKWAVEHRLLKRQRSMSYTKAEVKRVLADRRFKATFPLVDLGLAQLLHPAYTWGATLDEILSIDGAIYSAKEMAHRGKMWRTKRPWMYWPGFKSQARKANADWWVHRVMEINFLHE